MRAFEFVTASPWLITEAALQTIVSIAERTNEAGNLEALMTQAGKPLMGSRRVVVRDGVAIVPMVGPIMRYANLFSDISGATSTEILARDLRTAIDDPLIDAIVIESNSPGGAVAGINELADMIYEGRKAKPIVAYADHEMGSAAYWISSAADEIVVDRTAVVGSVGAVMTILDTRQREERGGVRRVEIVSSHSPNKRISIDSDEGRAKLQQIVDDLGEVFVQAVARNRAVTAAKVLADFGGGGLLVGERAVEAGLADRLGSLEQVVAELSANRKQSFFPRVLGMKTPKGPITVATTAEFRSAIEAGHTPEEISLKAFDAEAIRAEARAALQTELDAKHKTDIEAARKEATETAVKAERQRVVGLQAIALQGFEKEVQAAIESGATVEATAVDLTKAARTRGVTLGALRGDVPAPVSAGGGGAPAAQSAGWDKITAKFKQRKMS